MRQKFSALILNRRSFVVSSSKAALLLGFVNPTGGALAGEDAQESSQFLKSYRELVGSLQPVRDLITLTLPDFFDNGHAVPFTISVDSPMTESSFISTIHMVSTANPVAKVASFYLTPACGEATISGRFRLAKSQDVYVLAERNDGSLYVASQFVQVAIGGCS